MPWTCDGVPKDGKDYPQAIPGGHPPHLNTTPDCMICGLPEESMQVASGALSGQTTVVSTPPTKTMTTATQKPKSQWLIPAALAVVVLLLAGGGYAAYKILFTTDKNGNGSRGLVAEHLISPVAQNQNLISQGERTLLDFGPDKQQGETAFRDQDWDTAMDAYQRAVDRNPNDPESRIYLNNTEAQKAGNPLTIAVVVPTTNDPNVAKEILRGVAKAQEEFNAEASSSLLQVVITDDRGGLNSKTLATDLIKATNILGVIGHGIDPFSEEAIQEYESQGVAILSPRTVRVTDGSTPTLTVIPMSEKDDELLEKYLEAVGATLSEYAGNQRAILFYNSDSSYSNQLREDLVNSAVGTVIQEVDIQGGFDAVTEISKAVQNGAKVAYLALNKDSVADAIAIAEANFQSGSPLLLLGGDQLYSPEILQDGGDAIKGIVLAVPWSFEMNDPFAIDALKSWRGKVSWRTATAYDATRVLAEVIRENPDRAQVLTTLENGYSLKDLNTDFSIFEQVPLVKAEEGANPPPNSKYGFVSIH